MATRNRHRRLIFNFGKRIKMHVINSNVKNFKMFNKKCQIPDTYILFLECPTNTYKDTIGNAKCTDCPKNSKSSTGESRCLCNDNFYHFQGDNHVLPCYGT